MNPDRTPRCRPGHRSWETALVALSLIGLAACSGTTEFSTTAAGHPVSLEIAGDHSLEADAERGVIRSPHGTVVIEATRIRLDTADWTAIDANVPVDVRIVPGKTTLTAGRVKVERTVN